MDDQRTHYGWDSKQNSEEIERAKAQKASRRRAKSSDLIRKYDPSLIGTVALLVPLALIATAIWGLSGHPLYGDGECWANCESIED